MWRRNLFGGRYQPVEQLMSDIAEEFRSKARDGLDELHKEGLVQYHKNRKCASINPSHKDDVRDVLDSSEHVPDYLTDLR